MLCLGRRWEDYFSWGISYPLMCAIECRKCSITLWYQVAFIVLWFAGRATSVSGRPVELTKWYRTWNHHCLENWRHLNQWRDQWRICPSSWKIPHSHFTFHADSSALSPTDSFSSSARMNVTGTHSCHVPLHCATAYHCVIDERDNDCLFI